MLRRGEDPSELDNDVWLQLSMKSNVLEEEGDAGDGQISLKTSLAFRGESDFGLGGEFPWHLALSSTTQTLHNSKSDRPFCSSSRTSDRRLCIKRDKGFFFVLVMIFDIKWRAIGCSESSRKTDER
jgi:hypothetical protein